MLHDHDLQSTLKGLVWKVWPKAAIDCWLGGTSVYS